MNRIRIFLVDDHRLLLDTWTLLLNSDPNLLVIGSTSAALQANELVKALKPDVVLVDIAMVPLDGFQLTRQLTSQRPHPQVIGVSLYKMPAYVKKLFIAGARGYVTKNSSREELTEAIMRVNAGQKYICQEVKDYMSGLILGDSTNVETAINKLTRRELLIIGYVKMGLTSKEIAKQESITTKTVEVHRYNIQQKLGVNNVASLLNLIHAHGL